MRILIIIAITLSSVAFGQRPDLALGFNGSIRLLSNGQETSSFMVPGAHLLMEVSKRSWLVGLQSGYWVSIDQGDVDPFKNQHYLNLDLVPGFMIIRKPKFKMIFKAVLSNAFSLASKNKLLTQSLYSRYTLQLIPELSFRYKLVEGGFTYTIPIYGTFLNGPGMKLGLRF